MMIRWPKRDASLRIFYKRSEISKLVLKSLLASSSFFFSEKVFFYKAFQKFSFKSSISFYRRSCLITGSSRSVFKMFKLSRNQSKAKASHGYIVGLRKSSF
jgi:small subunit ribosomal protein S14